MKKKHPKEDWLRIGIGIDLIRVFLKIDYTQYQYNRQEIRRK